MMKKVFVILALILSATLIGFFLLQYPSEEREAHFQVEIFPQKGWEGYIMVFYLNGSSQVFGNIDSLSVKASRIVVNVQSLSSLPKENLSSLLRVSIFRVTSSGLELIAQKETREPFGEIFLEVRA